MENPTLYTQTGGLGQAHTKVWLEMNSIKMHEAMVQVTYKFLLNNEDHV